MRSRFGIYIPPWRKVDLSKKCVTLEFVLTGPIPSKKNRQRASFNYSWVIAQVKYFFKVQGKEEISVKECVKFLINLIRKIKPFIYKPKVIQDWEKSAAEEIIFQANYWREVFHKQGLAYPITKCSVSIKFYWADKRERDNDNRSLTIHDILKQAGIISEDNYKVLFKTQAEADCYNDEVVDHLTLIHVTAYAW